MQALLEANLRLEADRFEQHLASTKFCYSLFEKYDHDSICAMFN